MESSLAENTAGNGFPHNNTFNLNGDINSGDENLKTNGTATLGTSRENAVKDNDIQRDRSKPIVYTSRYGRTRKPKITKDFYRTDDVIDAESEQAHKKIKNNSFTKSLKLKSAKFNISEGKCEDMDIDSSNINRIQIPVETVDAELENYENVLKIITSQKLTEPIAEKKSLTPPKPLKTYSNKRKRSQSDDLPFSESLIATLNTFSWNDNLCDSITLNLDNTKFNGHLKKNCDVDKTIKNLAQTNNLSEINEQINLPSENLSRDSSILVNNDVSANNILTGNYKTHANTSPVNQKLITVKKINSRFTNESISGNSKMSSASGPIPINKLSLKKAPAKININHVLNNVLLNAEKNGSNKISIASPSNNHLTMANTKAIKRNDVESTKPESVMKNTPNIVDESEECKHSFVLIGNNDHQLVHKDSANKNNHVFFKNRFRLRKLILSSAHNYSMKLITHEKPKSPASEISAIKQNTAVCSSDINIQNNEKLIENKTSLNVNSKSKSASCSDEDIKSKSYINSKENGNTKSKLDVNSKESENAKLKSDINSKEKGNIKSKSDVNSKENENAKLKSDINSKENTKLKSDIPNDGTLLKQSIISKTGSKILETLINESFDKKSDQHLNSGTNSAEIKNGSSELNVDLSDHKIDSGLRNEGEDIAVAIKIENDNTENGIAIESQEIVKLEKTNNKEDVPCYWNVGDLTWAQIGKHPYWPCMLTVDPITDNYTKVNNIGKSLCRYFHVRFFADKGRRSWIASSGIIKFEGRKAFEKLAAKVFSETRRKELRRHAVGFTVPAAVQPRWLKAVEEAQSLVEKSVEERLNFFDELNNSLKSEKSDTGAKKRKRKSDDSSYSFCNVKKKKKFDSKITISHKKKLHRKMAKLYVKKKLRKLNRIAKNKISSDTLSESLTDENVASTSIDVNNKNNETPLPRRRFSKNVKDLEIDAKSENYEYFILQHKKNVIKENPSFSEREVNEYLEKKWSKLSIKEKCTYIKSEEKIEEKIEPSSDDLSSDIDDKENKSDIVENAAVRNKRNNLFKGKVKGRVCQICEKPNNVIKCGGTCLRYYHPECVKFEDSVDSNNLVKSSETQTETIIDIVEKQPDESQIESLKTVKDKLNGDIETASKLSNQTGSCIDVIANTKSDSSKDDSIDEKLKSPKRIIKTINFKVAEQIDAKMEEVMKGMIENPKYAITSSEGETSESDNTSVNSKNVLPSFHVTGDSKNPTPTKLIKLAAMKQSDIFKCSDCINDRLPPCFICKTTTDTELHRCSVNHCGKVYHPECLEPWPQTQWSSVAPSKVNKHNGNYGSLTCPYHVCHICVSDDPRGAKSRFVNEKLAKCVRCPTTYHASNYCIPAGSEILASNFIICPKHTIRNEKTKKVGKIKLMQHVNASWCFICAKGGSLICCETCPTSFHAECLSITPPEGSYICEDCETGRLLLYDEIVWVKLGNYRWWPARILFPNEVPNNVKAIPHAKGEFVVKFFGSHDHYWVNRGRAFLYQEGDKGNLYSKKSTVDDLYIKSLEEAVTAHKRHRAERANREAEAKPTMRPPPYIRIKTNRPVGNVKLPEMNTSSMTPCNCNPNDFDPCGPDSDCLNRLLLTECSPQICPAGERCNNQMFEKRLYPDLTPFRTLGRGWGLKTLMDISQGQFIIEYVGEMIDEQEYQRRIQRMHQQKDENYYFLTIDKDRMLDAGPKGNVARFMNHSCQPNCETQKWTVNGDTRVGLFALRDIPADSELTFNYNLECVGKEKKPCKCGAAVCSGFIGVKVKQDDTSRRAKTKPRKKDKIKKPLKMCFSCGKEGADGRCDVKNCLKNYHADCVDVTEWPEGKWHCPRHRCYICSKRKTRWCSKCPKAFCALHFNENIFEGTSPDEYFCEDHKIKEDVKKVVHVADIDLAEIKSSLTSNTDKNKKIKILRKKDNKVKKSNNKLKKSVFLKKKIKKSVNKIQKKYKKKETKKTLTKKTKTVKKKKQDLNLSMEHIDVDSKTCDEGFDNFSSEDPLQISKISIVGCDESGIENVPEFSHLFTVDASMSSVDDLDERSSVESVKTVESKSETSLKPETNEINPDFETGAVLKCEDGKSKSKLLEENEDSENVNNALKRPEILNACSTPVRVKISKGRPQRKSKINIKEHNAMVNCIVKKPRGRPKKLKKPKRVHKEQESKRNSTDLLESTASNCEIENSEAENASITDILETNSLENVDQNVTVESINDSDKSDGEGSDAKLLKKTIQDFEMVTSESEPPKIITKYKEPVNTQLDDSSEITPKRKRGRPRKNSNNTSSKMKSEDSVNSVDSLLDISADGNNQTSLKLRSRQSDVEDSITSVQLLNKNCLDKCTTNEDIVSEKSSSNETEKIDLPHDKKDTIVKEHILNNAQNVSEENSLLEKKVDCDANFENVYEKSKDIETANKKCLSKTVNNRRSGRLKKQNPEIFQVIESECNSDSLETFLTSEKSEKTELADINNSEVSRAKRRSERLNWESVPKLEFNLKQLGSECQVVIDKCDDKSEIMKLLKTEKKSSTNIEKPLENYGKTKLRKSVDLHSDNKELELRCIQNLENDTDSVLDTENATDFLDNISLNARKQKRRVLKKAQEVSFPVESVLMSTRNGKARSTRNTNDNDKPPDLMENLSDIFSNENDNRLENEVATDEEQNKIVFDKFAVDNGNTSTPIRRKRGRPRKYFQEKNLNDLTADITSNSPKLISENVNDSIQCSTENTNLSENNLKEKARTSRQSAKKVSTVEVDKNDTVPSSTESQPHLINERNLPIRKRTGLRNLIS